MALHAAEGKKPRNQSTRGGLGTMPDKVAFVAERASAMADNAPGLKFRLRLPLSRDRRRRRRRFHDDRLTQLAAPSLSKNAGDRIPAGGERCHHRDGPQGIVLRARRPYRYQGRDYERRHPIARSPPMWTQASLGRSKHRTLRHNLQAAALRNRGDKLLHSE